MKINPPGGDGFKIPEKPDPKRTDKADKVSGPEGSQFEQQMEQTTGAEKTGGVDKTAATPSSELRGVLRDLDPEHPEKLKAATEKMVEWVLKDSFGDTVLQAKGAEGLREAIRDQLLNDPGEAARLQRIIDRL